MLVVVVSVSLLRVSDLGRFFSVVEEVVVLLLFCSFSVTEEVVVLLLFCTFSVTEEEVVVLLLLFCLSVVEEMAVLLLFCNFSVTEEETAVLLLFCGFSATEETTGLLVFRCFSVAEEETAVLLLFCSFSVAEEVAVLLVFCGFSAAELVILLFCIFSLGCFFGIAPRLLAQHPDEAQVRAVLGLLESGSDDATRPVRQASFLADFFLSVRVIGSGSSSPSSSGRGVTLDARTKRPVCSGHLKYRTLQRINDEYNKFHF